MQGNRLSPAKKMLFGALMVVMIIAVLEICFTALFLYKYRITGVRDIRENEISYLSLVNIWHKVGGRLGFLPSGIERKLVSVPTPFYSSDELLGFKSIPGVYTHTYFRKYPGEDEWEHFNYKITINKDGTRWTGTDPNKSKPAVYIFGDSFVFGVGVNDEQTFAALLQRARPDVNVRLLAFGGYGLTQAYLNFGRLRSEVASGDVVIVGYADFFDVRNVVAPSRVREVYKWAKNVRVDLPENIIRPKAAIGNDGKIQITYVQESCANNSHYSEQDDPPAIEMSKVSAALINAIGESSKARVFLLHLDGSLDNPVLRLLDSRVTLISTLPKDFDGFVRDDVGGFDPHPGPYWHYAISRKLIDVIAEAIPKARLGAVVLTHTH